MSYIKNSLPYIAKIRGTWQIMQYNAVQYNNTLSCSL